MKVLSIKYRFCTSVDLVRYDSFDIKGPRSLEAMVQTHLEYTTPARHSVSGWQNTKAPVFGSSMEYTIPGRYKISRRRDDVLLTTSTGEGASFVTDDDGLDDESDVDPPREPGPDGAEVGLFSKPEPVPTILEDVERGSDDDEEVSRFNSYSPSAHIHNVDLSQDDALKFPDLPHRRRDRTSLSLDLGEIEVGREFSNKDNFLAALKQPSIMNEVNYNVVKSKSNKFEAKCVVQDGTCVSQDYPKMDSDMLVSLILSKLKADSKTSVPVLIVNIRSQLRYTPSYRKVWIAKQKALEKIRVFKCLFWSFKQWRDAFIYCKPLVQIDGSFMYGRYTHRLLLAVAQDDSGRIIPIVFAITLGESADNWDFFLSRLRRHICPQLDICVISDWGTGIVAAIERQESQWHRTHHRYCLRHVASNYYGQYRSTTERRQVTNMGYEISNDRFNEMLTVFVQLTKKGGHVWCRKVLREINRAKASANTMHIVCHDRDILWFLVTEFDRSKQGFSGGQYRVHLRNRTCDCGVFDALRYPCAHVITVCQNLHLDLMTYVDQVYKIKYLYNVWRHVFPPIPDER
ncbi:hypothetical protein GOBAR_AA00678 [Gossypium barbadense]|uniref:SWIM-type domain-containing protein n=1 Tax=Gossypium barbadense TaxID=3634 RepID=A0A2P5YWB3_GOSBA|nr:hypothetical protein GOBAR_AA00678 [Gossypium barbadense]